MPRRQDKRVVSGQFIDHGTHASLDEVTEVHSITGHWVGMIGGDYYGKGVGLNATTFAHDPEWKQDADWRVTNPIFIDYWKKGGLVTLCLHALNPQTGNSSWMRKHGDTINLKEIITPGCPGYDVWMRQLDLIAQGLQELEDEGVVVLLRPFHEMNGKWFWWGATNSREEFIHLWRFTFNYLTRKKGLDNLLWVYSPGASSGNYLDFYPGGAYVDIVGIDTYSKTPSQIRAYGYDALTKLGKPFGITEYGPSNLTNWDKDPRRDFNYEAFIQGVAEHLPLCTFFGIRHQYYGLHFQKNAKQCLDHPCVINLEDLPRFGR
jgi:mannan endo-1,4-beta-mannosidase